MGIFGDYDVRLDPWEVEYGPEFPLDMSDDATSDQAVLDVELPAERWQPISPVTFPTFAALYFVDGVRRIEARILVSKREQMCHGAFASVAIGSAAITPAGARCELPLIERVAVLGSGAMLPGSIAVAPALSYEPTSWPEAEVDGPVRAVQSRMLGVEERLVRRLAENQDALVIADGPLNYEHPVKGNVLGYIKRVFKLYLPTKYLSVVSSLAIGQRTPLFVLRGWI